MADGSAGKLLTQQRCYAPVSCDCSNGVRAGQQQTHYAGTSQIAKRSVCFIIFMAFFTASL